MKELLRMSRKHGCQNQEQLQVWMPKSGYFINTFSKEVLRKQV